MKCLKYREKFTLTFVPLTSYQAIIRNHGAALILTHNCRRRHARVRCCRHMLSCASFYGSQFIQSNLLITTPLASDDPPPTLAFPDKLQQMVGPACDLLSLFYSPPPSLKILGDLQC